MALYALLVGIDAYRSPIGCLRGAVRDVDRAAEFLDTVATDGFHPLVLKDAAATRAAVIDGFRSHLSAAGRDDAVLFWFSGHGSLAPVPPRFARLEPTGMMQTMLCVDSRHGGVPDLLDKELSILISEVGAGGAHVTAVLDCCHADGATREEPPPDRLAGGPAALGVRWAPTAGAAPAAGLLLPELRDMLSSADDLAGGLLHLPEHVSLAACHSNQVAYEVPTPEGHRGVFSLMLLGALADRGATCRELLARTRCLVESRVARQCPVLYPTTGGIADQPFLGGRLDPPRSAMTMRFFPDAAQNGAGVWRVDAGACHGLAAGTPDDPTLLGVYDDPSSHQVRVVRVLPDRCVVEPIDWSPGPNEQFPMVVTRVPVPPIAVEIEETEPQSALLRDALDHSGAGGMPSVYLRIVDPADTRALPGLRVRFPEPDVALVIDSSGGALIPPTGYGTAAQAQSLVADLEHIARWLRIRGLENTGSALNAAVAIEVVEAMPGERVDPLDRAPLLADGTGAVQLSYRHTRGGPTNPRAFIRVRNRSDRQLYCVLLDLTDRFRMHPNLLPGTWVAPGHAACALDGGVIELTLPPGRPAVEGASGTDWLKVLISEAPIGSELFRLPRLGDADRTSRTAPPAPLGGVLDRLGFAAMFRDFDAPAPRARDWGTAILTVVTSVPKGEA